jgi:hypothetical protein
MSSELIARLREGVVDTGPDANASKEAADEIERLEIQVARYQGALEKIRDQTFQQANSPRLIDQLWHFVRWTKSVAREALEGTGAKEDETDSEREQI